MTSKRYWKDDEIDWRWLNRAACGVAGKLSDDERIVAQSYYLGGKLAVLKRLTKMGEIEIEADENAQALARQYSAYLVDRRRQHGNWARSRRSTTYWGGVG